MGVFSYLFNRKKPLKWTFPLPCADTFIKPKDASNLYFDKLHEIREHNKNKNYFLLIYTCVDSVNLLPKMVRGWKQEFGGSFDIDVTPGQTWTHPPPVYGPTNRFYDYVKHAGFRTRPLPIFSFCIHVHSL